MPFVYLKDRFVEDSQAVLPVSERGFRLGDGVFETISVHHSIPYQWERHAARLLRGCEMLRLSIDITHVADMVREIIYRNAMRDGFVRLSVSRGAGGQGYLPAGHYGDAGRPGMLPPSTLIIETMPRYNVPTSPVRLWLSSFRKVSGRALPVQAKLMQGMNSTLAKMEAADQGCYDALMLGEEGQITEAASGNIFWVRRGTLYTPSLECGVLAGVMRSVVLDLSPFPVEQGIFTLKSLHQAEEVFVTNVAWGILPVSRLEPIGLNFTPGHVTEALSDAVRHDRENYVAYHKAREAALAPG